MTISDIVATAKRMILERKSFEKVEWAIDYLVRDLKPNLEAVQRMTLAMGILRQAKRELETPT